MIVENVFELIPSDMACKDIQNYFLKELPVCYLDYCIKCYIINQLSKQINLFLLLFPTDR